MNGKSRTHCLTKWEDKKLGPTYCTNMKVKMKMGRLKKIGAYLLYKHEWEMLLSLAAPHVNACDIYRLIEGSR